MSRPRVPKLTLHKATGQARVLLRGRHVYLGKYGSPEADEKYRRIVGEFLRTGESPVEVRPKPTAIVGAGGEPAESLGDPDGQSVDEVILRFWGWAEGYYVKDGEPTSELSSLKLSLRGLRGMYGSTPAAEFGPLKLKTLREQAIRDGLSRNGANRRAAHIKRMFKWAVAEELVPPSVHHGLTAVAGLRRGRTEAREPEPVKPVDPRLVDATLPHLPPIVADMVRLQLLTGMRPGEVCSLRPRDVDRSKEVWSYRPASHKTQHHGKARTVFVGKEAQAILAPFLVDRPEDKPCFSPAESEEKRRAAATAARITPASCGNGVGKNRKKRPTHCPGDRYRTASYGRCVRRASENAVPLPPDLAEKLAAIKSLPKSEQADVRAAVKQHRKQNHWTPNQLRHTRATQLRAAFGVETARTVLGHSHLTTTEIYAERDLAAAERAMREVG